MVVARMRILKALVFDESGKTQPSIRDAIDYQGKLWLSLVGMKYQPEQ
jgi:hypothetical protein